MTKAEAKRLIAEYEQDPSGDACDNLCTVLDALPGQPEGDYSPEEVRTLVEELL